MTRLELDEIIEQRMTDSRVVGRIACNLRDAHDVVQRHHDGATFSLAWQDAGDYWHCIITNQANALRLMQVDLHENGTVRMETDEPCRVTVSPEDNILSVTRYRR